MFVDEEKQITFIDKEHYDFYKEKTQELTADCYHRALIYTLSLCKDTRRNFNKIYNTKERCIEPDIISAGWQTGTSVKVTRLAFQLFTDSLPTVCSYDENDRETVNFNEFQKYSVSEIFCCELAPFFICAIGLRYPEYFRN